MNPTLQQASADGGAQDKPTPPEGQASARKPLGALLLQAGFLDETQLDHALFNGSQTGERLGEVVVRLGLASEDDVARLLAEQWGLRYVDRASIWFDADALTRLSREDAQRLEALPTRVEGGRVVCAVAEPTEQRLEALRRLIGDDTVVVVVPKTALEAGIHSELLTSRGHTPPVPERRPPPESPPPSPPPESPPQPTAQVAVPSAPALEAPEELGGMAALAAQAQSVADSIAVEAAAMHEKVSLYEESRDSAEKLEASRARIEVLEAELAARAAAMHEAKLQLSLVLRLLDPESETGQTPADSETLGLPPLPS